MIIQDFFECQGECGVSAGKRDQIEIFFKKKFLSKIDVDLIIWSRTFIISKKKFLSIWSLFPALTPYIVEISEFLYSTYIYINILSGCRYTFNESDYN